MCFRRAWKTTPLLLSRGMKDDSDVARAADRYAPAAHTLNPVLLPTTCVVVNKPPGLKHFPTTGLRPPVRKSFTPTAKSQHSHPAPRRLSLNVASTSHKGMAHAPEPIRKGSHAGSSSSRNLPGTYKTGQPAFPDLGASPLPVETATPEPAKPHGEGNVMRQPASDNQKLRPLSRRSRNAANL